MPDIYRKEGIDMLKRGYSLPNLANFCLHKSTTAKIYRFTESDRDLLDKIREGMFVGQPLYSHGKLLWT